ncbi:MAG: LemA family protein [Planctomycetia bacterium]|nr:LemA family protein [Planctomycetia bacterium]
MPSVYYHATVEEHWSRTDTETVIVNGKPPIRTRSELKSNELFINLQQNLIYSEERIALARNYYNDSVEAFHNRREIFPDCCVAPLLRLSVHQYITADHFEIKPISVYFE